MGTTVSFRGLLLLLVVGGISSLSPARQRTLLVFQQPAKQSVQRLFGGAPELLRTVQNDLIQSQEQYVQQSIGDEASVLARADTASASISGAECPMFVKRNTEAIMSVAGISISNCISEVDDALFTLLYPDAGEGDRQQYAKASLLASFRGENVFIDPDEIVRKLNEKLDQPGVELTNVNSIAEHAAELSTSLSQCMEAARTLLMHTLQITSQQVDAICAQGNANGAL